MSRDPFPGWQTVPASQHGYSYVHNNPVNLTDPSGEFVPAALVAAAAACPLCVLGGAVVVGVAWIIIGPELADLLAPVFTDMVHGAERAIGQIARDTRTRADDFLEQCAVIVETAFQQQAQRQSQQEPKNTPESIDFYPPITPIAPTPTPNNNGDYIWRGIQKLNPATGDFHPRLGQDDNGLSFFYRRMNAFINSGAYKKYRAGFTEQELISAGFSVRFDGGTVDPGTGEMLPVGHVSVKRIMASEWTMWLNREPGQPYSAMLRDMARANGRVEHNLTP